MPRISKAEKERNHQRIVDAAGRRLNTSGLDGVGIDDVMKDAGLTHGGFYNHFESKDALAVEVCQHAFAEAAAFMEAEIAAGEHDGSSPLCRMLSRYLSPEHRDHPEIGCASSTFVVDASRHVGPIQDAYRDGAVSYIDAFTRALLEDAERNGRPLDAESARKCAMLLLTQIVGAMAVSRAVAQSDPDLSSSILSTARDGAIAVTQGIAFLPDSSEDDDRLDTLPAPAALPVGSR